MIYKIGNYTCMCQQYTYVPRFRWTMEEKAHLGAPRQLPTICQAYRPWIWRLKADFTVCFRAYNWWWLDSSFQSQITCGSLRSASGRSLVVILEAAFILRVIGFLQISSHDRPVSGIIKHIWLLAFRIKKAKDQSWVGMQNRDGGFSKQLGRIFQAI